MIIFISHQDNQNSWDVKCLALYFMARHRDGQGGHKALQFFYTCRNQKKRFMCSYNKC